MISKGSSTILLFISLVLPKYFFKFNSVTLILAFILAIVGLDIDLMADHPTIMKLSEPLKFLQISTLVLAGSFCTLIN